MKLRSLIYSIGIPLLGIIALLSLAYRDASGATDIASNKIESSLLDQISAFGSADFIVRFNDQPDLTPAYSLDWATRGEFVYNSLREAADRSQASAKAILDTQGLSYQTFIAGNDLYVWASTQPSSNAITALNELAELPEVNFIRATRTYTIDPVSVPNPFETIQWAGDYLAKQLLTTVAISTTATMDWGIADTKADQFWAQFGKGAGIVVANIDTGVQWNHPALDQAFKCGTNPSNPSCWYEPVPLGGSSICGGSACDNNGHGTHTMGTMVGDDDPSLQYIVGMAPDAKWIACKGCQTSSCSDFALNACADWILAPGGSTANRPNVVNNSWGGSGGDAWYQAKVQAWVAAGIFPAFSAGNSGDQYPYCGTLGSPGDYQESFGSAAHNSSRGIASFSSKGPSVFGHEPFTKPNVSAPGVSICSSLPGNTWSCGYSGTSMASPHSAGAVALLWSCNPTLVGQVDATFQLLQDNADPPPTGTCGSPPDGQGNYTYGYGYLDVFQAGTITCGATHFGAVDGHVYDQNSNPVMAASVRAVPSVQGNATEVFTDPTGYYTMTIPVGTYDVTASKGNYQPQTVNGLAIVDGVVTHQDFSLVELSGWTQIPLPSGCPDWTRFDGAYYPPTGKVYFLGGRGGSDGSLTFGDVYSFNPVTKTCSDTGANMPTPVSNYTIALVNNGINDLLCVFGGRPSAGGVTSAVQCYDPVANSASQVSTLPVALAAFVPGGVSPVNGKVLVFGGFQNSSSPYETKVTYEWDPAENLWTQKGNLPLGMGYIQAATVNGMVYAFGGTTFDGSNLNAQVKTAVYDPTQGTWNDAAVAELAAPGAEGRAFGFNSTAGYDLAGKIVIVGGGQFPGETAGAFTYNVATNTYDESFPDLTVARRDQAGFFVPGNPGVIWVFGGRSGADVPPYAPPEYRTVGQPKTMLLPVIMK